MLYQYWRFFGKKNMKVRFELYFISIMWIDSNSPVLAPCIFFVYVVEACTKVYPKVKGFAENKTEERKLRRKSFEIVVIEFVTSESGTHRRENDYTHAGSILIKSGPAE